MQLDPMEMLLRLTGDLSNVNGRVKTLEEQQVAAALAAFEEKMATSVGGLEEQLAAVVAVIQQMQAEPEEEPSDGPGTAPNWNDVNQDQARELWDWLTSWCQNVLWPTYAQSVWKPCWYRHQQVRIQLTWLCAYWHWAYEQHAPPTRAAEWHVRWWPHVEQVLKKELKECGYPSDNLPKPRHPVPVPVADSAAPPAPFSIDDFVDHRFFERVEKDIARRPEAEKKDEAAAE
ncbi:hypothetical protein AB0G85_33180 [Streptomyces sioyaensis]|uniref:hypothetical protein n=1 Tax=Streptomyces sioyaensis TaxID=67364 RepID=UPI0034079042